MKRIRTPLITAAEPDTSRIRCPWMIRADMPSVLMIDNRSFERAWDEDDFMLMLRPRNCIGKVAKVTDAGHEFIAGFVLYELHRHHVHLLKFAVDPFWRRQRVGSALIASAAHAGTRPRREMTATVRETNLPAQLFLRSCGFTVARRDILRGHCEGEAAYVFRRRVRECKGK